MTSHGNEEFIKIFPSCPSSDYHRFLLDTASEEYLFKLSYIIGIILGLLTLILLTSTWLVDFFDFSDPLIPIKLLIGLVLTVVPLAIIHEILHIIVLPKSKNKIVIGYSLRRLSLLVFFTGIIKRNDHFISLLTPFCLLTIFPSIYIIIIHPPYAWLVLPIVMNAFISGGDVAFAYFVLKEIPPMAKIVIFNDGMYWYK